MRIFVGDARCRDDFFPPGRYQVTVNALGGDSTLRDAGDQIVDQLAGTDYTEYNGTVTLKGMSRAYQMMIGLGNEDSEVEWQLTNVEDVM